MDFSLRLPLAAKEDCPGAASSAKPGFVSCPAQRGKLRLGRPKSVAGEYHYVYILVSLSFPGRHYTGCTTDLEARLRAHNEGKCPHTSKFIP